MILGKIKKHGKVNHSTVNYINNYPVHYLYAYGLLVIDEMLKRGFNINPDIIREYQTCEALEIYEHNKTIFKEHVSIYLQDCIRNLANKGITIKI
jgi:uncharacterized protein (TIGR02328 family)